ncbi:RDD family protein [Streptoalloteichus tenebrarius]|uniref:RDD family protein n=1 Tax=Streptoalloteichus tenebrarius (strain ATCC 17920 / DSM 40477 / JCM 4838 / CBS 697.72 / NBRC 16177 / NCIMB 11028 / NRRL B-12390 / A12253. 1 / ISP 5477) TaxID=1933 RepID=A0ABT1I3L1_STRSD|nr:RDD family protein [Streptoalloteichus tenebrarius]MCP2262371.1 RDD family protein [Streptoalloteichus tenebrarius]BFF00628.1 RDD family protein [Streptoalloteichus tenebrarius]
MASRWTGSWLSGPGAAQEPGADDEQQRWRGERLGLPQDGPDAVAGWGRRAVALLIDWVPCALVAEFLTQNPATSALALFAVYVTLAVAFTGRTVGKAAVGLRVARVADRGRPPVGAAVIRAVLTCLVIPPVVYDKDGRGLHDRAVGTVVLRTR